MKRQGKIQVANDNYNELINKLKENRKKKIKKGKINKQERKNSKK